MNQESSFEDSSPVTRPQVFVMVSESILGGVYRNRLQREDYCLVWCERGERWKEALLSFPYDIVVVDFSLFGAEPIEGLIAIQKLSPESEIIVLSESENVRHAISAFQLGVSDYLLKPTDPETLAWAIGKIVRRKQIRTGDESLGADLEVFRAAHYISMSESPEKMRSRAAKHLARLFGARAAFWVWEDADGSAKRELWTGHESEGEAALEAFLQAHPGLLKETLGSDKPAPGPESWPHGKHFWIPLKESWMGGLFLYAPSVPISQDSNFNARLEFLVRSLEISLENQRRYSEVKQLTFLDDLTGLYNARYLEVALSAAIAEYGRSKTAFSILFIDIDRFKSVNDGNGHLVGSQMLIELSLYLKQALRKPDQLFRYGGDEFICLLFGADSRRAMEVAERLRADVERKGFYIDAKEYKITLSIGVAGFPEHGKTKKEILQMADDAMYAGKKSGRNSVFLAVPESTPLIVKK